MVRFCTNRRKLQLLTACQQRAAAVLLLLNTEPPSFKTKWNRRFQVHPVNQHRLHCGEFFVKYERLRQSPDKFFDYLRMSTVQFDFILKRVTPHIEKFCLSRLPISPEERLFLTLRYLTSGIDMKAVAESFHLGHTTTWQIIHETCMAIYVVLKDFVRVPRSSDDWRSVAKKFEEKCAMPHCCGALDGKHVLMRKPRKSGSMFFSYKKKCSIVLLALADPNYCFLYFDVGSVGSLSDGRVFRTSRLGKETLYIYQIFILFYFIFSTLL